MISAISWSAMCSKSIKIGGDVVLTIRRVAAATWRFAGDLGRRAGRLVAKAWPHVVRHSQRLQAEPEYRYLVNQLLDGMARSARRPLRALAALHAMVVAPA